MSEVTQIVNKTVQEKHKMTSQFTWAIWIIYFEQIDEKLPPKVVLCDVTSYTRAPIGAKINQCHFETLELFDKITRLLLYYETKKSSSAHAHCAH